MTPSMTPCYVSKASFCGHDNRTCVRYIYHQTLTREMVIIWARETFPAPVETVGPLKIELLAKSGYSLLPTTFEGFLLLSRTQIQQAGKPMVWAHRFVKAR